jgi:hypothetical protein
VPGASADHHEAILVFQVSGPEYSGIIRRRQTKGHLSAIIEA